MKFIESTYENGLSTVTVEHMGMHFIGTARLHPDDEPYASEYAGCGIAESRAVIAALKHERKIRKNQCEECRKFVKACMGYKNFDKESPTAKAIFRQLNQRIKQVNELADEINAIYKSIDRGIWQRDLILKSIKAKKDKQD